MPNVFKIKIAINQFLWLLWADFHKAIPFQIKPQAVRAKNNNVYLGSLSIFIMLIICGSTIFYFLFIISYPATPNATDTFNDSFLPCIGR